MLPADMDMSAVNPALKLRPEAFNGVDAAAVGRRVLALIVADGDVIEAEHIKAAIAAKFVGRHGRAGQHVGLDKGFHRRAMAARHHLCHHVPAALKHPDDSGFVAFVSRPFALHRTANQCFVDLNNLSHAAERVATTKLPHIFADLMAHAPRRFVGNTKLALDFLGSNAVARSAEQKHDKEPIAQRCAGAIKRGASGRVNLMPAIFADIGAAGANAIVVRALAATRAVMAVAKAITHDVLKAAFLCREAGLELAKGGGFRLHDDYVAQPPKCRKGIITK